MLAPKTPNARMLKEVTVVFALKDTLVMASTSVMVSDLPLTVHPRLWRFQLSLPLDTSI